MSSATEPLLAGTADVVTGWNFADVWEAIAAARPDELALVQGDRRLSWQQMDERAGALAAGLLERGLEAGAKVALYLYNTPEYIETVFAAFKASLVPVNTNYRYVDDELRYLWTNADAEAVVFHGTFTPTIERIRGSLPAINHWLWVDDESHPCPSWAVPYEAVVEDNAARSVASSSRSGHDLLLLYTGGTTGQPKGVMWRQDDLFRNLIGNGISKEVRTGDQDLELVRSWLNPSANRSLPAPPLMHGAGLFTQFVAMTNGGATVLTTGRRLDAVEILDTIERESVTSLVIVGDAFARPLLSEIRSGRTRNLESLGTVISSGAMLSEPVKEALCDELPDLRIVDLFSSSEAMGMGRTVSSKKRPAATATFKVGGNTRVIDDDGVDVRPGSGQVGRVAVGGFQPIGYYKDEEKTAATFVTIDGRRYSVPGDYARVEVDGSITLLGRGSVCINSGGEKIFPEEVEEVLKQHVSVEDAVVVGVPDERLGQMVVAVVEPAGGAPVDAEDLIRHAKGSLASYKAPRHVVEVDTIGRGPNGKVDYERLGAIARERLA